MPDQDEQQKQNKSTGIVDPHDRFFRTMMQYQGFSSAFFDVHLPEKWSRHLEADSLALSNETHLDKQLQKTMSDLVFTCRIKGQTSYHGRH